MWVESDESQSVVVFKPFCLRSRMTLLLLVLELRVQFESKEAFQDEPDPHVRLEFTWTCPHCSRQHASGRDLAVCWKSCKKEKQNELDNIRCLVHDLNLLPRIYNNVSLSTVGGIN